MPFFPADSSLWIFAAGLFGLAIGSFLNVVIYRLPLMLEREWRQQCAEFSNEAPVESERFDLAFPRSRCPHCGHLIGALENIPVLSWLVLKGRCRSCKAAISIRYPLIEAATGILFAFALWHFGPGLRAVGAMFFIACLIALTFIDADTQLLPDDITLPLLWAGLIFNVGAIFTSLASAVLGAVFGYLALWLVYWGFKLLTGKEGMGYGDFKLLAAIGAWLGWQALPIVILLSSLVGAVVGIALMILARRGKDIPIPFGPYLAAAGLIALFWGPAIYRYYLQLT